MIDIAELGLSVRSDGVVIAGKRLDKLVRSAKKAETATQRLIRKTEKMNATMKKMGRNMALFASLPIIGLLGGAIRAFANFDEAMVSSMAIMGDLSDVMKKDMADAAKEMGLTTVFSAKQAADSYFFLASAGLSAEASIAALPKVAAFAQAGNFDMAKATDILTDAQSALGKVMKDPIENMKEMVKLSDVLVKANTMANASVQQFGEALTNKAGTAMKQLNIEIESGVAVLAAWADQGIKGVEAGEKFNIVTRDLQAAIRKNADEFKRFKIEVFEDGAFRNMGDIITDLEKAMEGMSVETQGNTLALLGFQDRSVIAIRSLLGLSDKIKGYEKGFRAAGDITEEVANKQMKTFNKQLGLMKDKIVGIGIALGEKLVPLLEGVRESLDDFLDSVNDGVDTFTSYDVETQKMILGAVAFAAAIGPILIVLGLLAGAIGALITPVAVIGGLMLTFAGTLAIASLTVSVGLALMELADIVVDIYVKSIEDAIEVTGDFQIALNTMDIEILSKNLKSADDKLNQFIDKREEVQQRLDVLQAKSGLNNSENIELERLLVLQEQNNRNVENQITLQRSLEERLRLAITLDKEIAEVLEEIVVTATRVGIAHKELTTDELEELTEWWKTLRTEIDPAAEAMVEFEAGVALLNIGIAAGEIPAVLWADAIQGLQKRLNEASGATDKFFKSLERVSKVKLESLDSILELDRLEEIIDPLSSSLRELTRELANLAALRKEFESEGFFLGDEYWDRIAKGLEVAIVGASALGSEMERVGVLAGGALRTIQSSISDGTKAYEALNIAIQASNVVAAIGAVLNQAKGDPYTAFARMAAMAAAVAALGVSISSFGGSFTDTAANRQDAQGTGSVLGDVEAKSESILRATEITADATSALVGINRRMLNALQSLSAGLSGAAGSIARNPQGGEFGGLPDVGISGISKFIALGGPVGSFIDKIFGGFFSSLVNKILGGKAKITDEGIAILAGTLDEAIGGMLVKAFREVQSKKFFFSGTKTREELIDLGDDASAQISLVFQAIGDTVREAALALGLNNTEIQAALDAFRIEEIRISLKGLNAADARAELEAVFSKIFDDLAGAVVPFIDQFQKVGEGLGETLIRVATSVQVMQEAIKQLGLAVDITDSEEFAKMSVALIELVGGIDQFISKFQNFVSKFATDEHKLGIAQDALIRGFESVGLILPDTAEGLWALFQSLDASTEAGRAQIAMILDLTDEADAFYNLLDSAERDRLALLAEEEQLRQDAFDTEIDALLRIQSIAEGVVATLTSLRDMIVNDISTPEENFNRAKAEAEKLAAALATMTDPEQISETVRRIEQLTRTAFGLLDADQKQVMGQQFLDFIDQVQAMALERLAASADKALAGTEFTPEEIMTRFNELVIDPLVLVAGLQESAALKLSDAADRLMAQTPSNFNIAPGPIGTAVGGHLTDSAAEDISAAVRAGLQAGAEAMAEAAVAVITAGARSDATSTASAQQIARAIRSIPSRIVIKLPDDQFS